MSETEVAQRRLKQLFQYLQAFEQQRNPVVRQISEQQWTLWRKDLPQHPCIRWGNNEEEEQDYVLKISRPKLTAVPAPPQEIKDWLLAGWDDYSKEARVIEVETEFDSEGNETKIRFDDDPQRVAAWKQWLAARQQWAQNERPAREAYRVFERVYTLYNRIEREAGRLELILGDGILSWRLAGGGIFHPILLQRIQLQFNSEIPEFTFQETSHPVELHTALLRSNPSIDPKIISQFRELVEKEDIHPLEDASTSSFLQKLVQRLDANGEFIAEGGIKGEANFPRVARDPVIFLRSGNPGFAKSIELVLQEIPTAEKDQIPSSLLNITGVGENIAPINDLLTTKLDGSGNEDEEILFNKPANPEQLMIAKRLERYGCVLVQGPPGTGKTHTIANLIGHLLAKGQSVLVTSHTAKALRVLRDKVDAQIQSLCVSVLDNDADSQRQMSNSIGQIAEMLNHDAEGLQKQANEVAMRRSAILESLGNLRQKLRQSREDEYRDLSVCGITMNPVEAAKIVAEGHGKHDWIPEPIQLGYNLPLSVSEITELYATNQVVSVEDEKELALSLPATELAMEANDFSALVQELSELRRVDLPDRDDLWRPGYAVTPKALDDLLNQLQRAVAPIAESQNEPFKLAVINDGRRGGAYHKVWEEFIHQINEVMQSAANCQSHILTFGPQLPSDLPLEQQVKISSEILQHLSEGGSLGRIVLMLHSEWKKLIERSAVNGVRPSKAEHFEALKQTATLQIQRTNLVTRWDRQMMPLGVPSATNFKPYPEEVCHQYVEMMQRLLNWQQTVWNPTEQSLRETGFQWEQFFQEAPLNLQPYGDLLRLLDAVKTYLPPIFMYRRMALRRAELEKQFSTYRAKIKAQLDAGQSVPLLSELLRAVDSLDSVLHKRISDRINELHIRHQSFSKRRELLNRLESVAKGWATAIRHRHHSHDQSTLPGDVEKAWMWRQLNGELEEIGRVSTETIQSLIDQKVEELHRVTAELVYASAWAHQIRRTRLEQKQALNGWVQTMRRIGKGTGKRVPQLLAEARKQMERCRSAVPVWIMPINRVVENYHPQMGLFDVVIVDEASQCDVMGLIALYLGKRVIVVGDHEQVSPDAVGKNVDDAQRLIDEYLQGIPNANLYDGKLSLYDLAMQSFSGSICLREHFRCVPEIIQFSNGLSYDWKIKPLRDGTHSNLQPAVISHYVHRGLSDSKVNRAEALVTASLVVAALEQPEYESQTFGIISLVGEEQAEKIGSILREKLSPAEMEKRRINFGNAAQFQGDERDVIFLSVVDGPTGTGPLTIRQDDRFKKRFNVAASRARNQLWVVHSLQPINDLKPGDLRRRLIQYAQNPQEYLQAEGQYLQRAESEFERQVMKRLLDAGYDVTPQWKVGAYRIDMVISGRTQRVALECDGERWHPIEKIPEDMERQATLERLGWKFIRIRGSEFFRDPESAMQRVFKRLEALGIEPTKSNEFVEPPKNDLWERVTRRAEQLRLEWDAGNVTISDLDFSFEDDYEANEIDNDIADSSSELVTQRRLFSPEAVIAPKNEPSNTVITGSDEIPTFTRSKNGKEQDIEELLYSLLPSRGKIERELLIKKAAQLLGYANLRRDLRGAINKTLSAMIRSGELQTDYEWRFLWRRL